MCLRCLSMIAVLLALVMPAMAVQQPLRFCADPDNLPYSNKAEAGFDNRIAILLARRLNRTPVFVWARERRGFLREEFNRGACDVLLGVPVGMKGILSTVPYYRSTYVFVTRRRDHLQITSFHDPQLNARRIGLQVMEEDLSPPSLSLVRSGHAGQLVGYNSFGRKAGNILRAVNTGEVGAAVVWGPLAGYYARHLSLDIRPVSPAVDHGIPFVFDIAMGVHVHDRDMRDQLSSAITQEAAAIERILGDYGVPLVSDGGGS